MEKEVIVSQTQDMMMDIIKKMTHGINVGVLVENV